MALLEAYVCVGGDGDTPSVPLRCFLLSISVPHVVLYIHICRGRGPVELMEEPTVCICHGNSDSSPLVTQVLLSSSFNWSVVFENVIV